MGEIEVPDHYFTFDGRLASFYSAQPVSRPKSSAKGRAPKTLAWPHKRLDPVDFAKAGFYFDPDSENTDNTVCFLCHKRLGGWDNDDNPAEEHLRHSQHCGWAIVAAIEAAIGDYAQHNPSHPDMMEARKATFAGRWPHEGKKGWRCKVKQMVDAGWKYTPTIDSDDMATCTYCQLALDGWEPKDQPLNEHYKRSPECSFFTLVNQFQSEPTKKTARGKASRSSKASRLSTQSVNTLASDVTSLHDQTASQEDSVMTTTSVMTAGGTKRGRAKKATTSRGKKTRAKKDEPVEVLDEVLEDAPEDTPPPPHPKPTRGRKRNSDAVDDSVLSEAPAPKKRAGRTRRSSTVESQANVSMADVPAPPPKVKGKKRSTSSTRSTRKVSRASTASTASFRSAANHLPDDDELDRQLLADLDRPLSDDEIMADSDSERNSGPVKPKTKKTTARKVSAESARNVEPSDHAMFDAEPVEVDDADISADYKKLQGKMDAEKAAALQVPKKGRKAGTRKASKQTKKAQPVVEPKALPVMNVLQDDDVDELSILSNTTVVKNSVNPAPPKKRGRPKKNSSQAAPVEKVEANTGAKNVDHVEPARKTTKASLPQPADDPVNSEPPSKQEETEIPATPQAAISLAPAAKQSALSPSQSPQSSDAENQPPSSKPSNTSTASRVALGPVEATPARTSPSKRNVHFMSGLESSHPWTALDLDLVFEKLGKENVAPGSKLEKGAQLSSPEKKMTVEEWIHHNAGLAEARLKAECEAMVSKFESEGGRAMNVLEELVVE